MLCHGAPVASYGAGHCGGRPCRLFVDFREIPRHRRRAAGRRLARRAPERTAQPVAFPPVHDIPPPRNSVTLTNTEQAQMERELVTAREEQQVVSGVAKPKSKDAKPVGRIGTPVSSRASIY